MTGFTPLASLLGGVLIGTAASLLLVGSGRIAGISSIASGLLSTRGEERTWRLSFLAGLLGGGLLLAWSAPGALGTPAGPWPRLALAGLLVGFGSRLGNGCTSGHGICGIARLSRRSLVAVAVFIATGALVVAVVARAAAHGGPP